MKLILGLLFAASLFAQCVHPCVTLSWGWANGTANVVGVNILRGTISGGPYTQVGNVPNTTTLTFSDQGNSTSMPDGSTFYYVLVATGQGGLISPYSNEAKAVIPFLLPPAPTTLQAVPK